MEFKNSSFTIGGLITKGDVTYTIGRTSDGGCHIHLRGNNAVNLDLQANTVITTPRSGQSIFVDTSGEWRVANGKTLTLSAPGDIRLESGVAVDVSNSTGTVVFQHTTRLADGASLTNAGTATMNGVQFNGEGAVINNTGNLTINGSLTGTEAWVLSGASSITYSDTDNGYRGGSVTTKLVNGNATVAADTISIGGTAYALDKTTEGVSVTYAVDATDKHYYVNTEVVYGDGGNTAASDETTGIVINGGNLVLISSFTKETAGFITSEKAGTITLNGEGTSLKVSSVAVSDGAAISLAGNGRYEVGTSMGGVTLADSWTGTVHSTGTGDTVSGFNFSDCVNANSKLEVSNWKGYVANNSGALGSNELIMGEGDAITITDGYSDTYYEIKKISGTGNLVRTNDHSSAAISLKITEDASTWTGTIKNQGGKVRLKLAGNGDVTLSAPIETQGVTEFYTEGSGIKTFSGAITKTGGSLYLKTTGTAVAKFTTSDLTFGTYDANGGGVTGTTMTVGTINIGAASTITDSSISVGTLNINGNTTITDSSITVTGTRLNLTSGTMTLHNSTLTVQNAFDARGTNANFTGGIAVTNKSVLDLKANGWMHENTFSVDKTSTIKQAGFEISATGDTAAAITMTDDGGPRTIPGSDKVAISNASITYKGTDEGTVAAVLTDSDIVAESGSVKLTNVGNSLKNIEAKGGDVILAADHTVNRDNNNGNVKLTAGSAIKIADGKTLSYDKAKFSGVGDEAAVTSTKNSELSLWATGVAGAVTFKDMDVTVEADDRDIYATLDNSSINVQGGTSTFKTAQTGVNNVTVGANGTLKADSDLTINGTLTVSAVDKVTVTGNLTLTAVDVTGLNVTEAGTYTLATMGGFTADTVTVTGLEGLDLTKLEWVLTAGEKQVANSSGISTMATGSTAGNLTLTVTNVTPPTPTEAPSVTAVGWSEGKLLLTITGDTNTASLAVLVGDDMWKQMMQTVTANGGSVSGEGVAISLVDAATGTSLDLDSYTSVTFNGYAGEGEGKYAVIYVPEPATTTLGLLALAGLAARRRRK